jgi:aminoglycoside phosphotransferase (APT) family kinase protein
VLCCAVLWHAVDCPQVLAVLDWELATLGNAWADVAYMCLAYHLPHALESMSLTHPLASGEPAT